MRGMWEGTPFPAFLLIKKVTKESDKLSKNKGSFRGDFYLIGKISCEIKNTRKTSFRNIRAFSCMFLSGFEPLAFRLGGGRSILLSYRNINFINNIPSNLFIITDLTKVSQDLSCNFCERFL